MSFESWMTEGACKRRKDSRSIDVIVGFQVTTRTALVLVEFLSSCSSA